MQLFDTKVAGDKVELKGEISGAKLVLTQQVDMLTLLAPALDKIKELIPGHFDDDLIEEAKVKLAAL